MKRRALVIVGCSLRSSYIPLYARKRGVVTVFVLPKGIDDKTQIIVNQDTYKLSVNFVKNAYDRKKEYNDDVDIFLESEKLSRFDLIDIIKKKYEVVAVTPGNDQLFQTNCIELADMFAKEFNVIGANDINTSILRSNKFYFNRHLDSCNLRSVPGFNVNSLAEYNALTSIKFPCIFKPSIGHGTINVFFAEDKNALDKIVNEYYKNEKHFTSVNIDEYIQGTEHEVNFVVVDGTILFINATTNVREVIGGVPLYRYAHSISDDDPVFASLVDYGKKVLKALNYKWGFQHMEMKVDKNGPVLIENNGRILGGHSFLFEKVVSGYSFTECLVESLLDKEFVKKFKNDKVDLYGYSFVLSSFSTFKLHACHVLDVVSKMPGFLNFATPLKIGDIVNPTTNLHNAIGFLCFVSKSYDEMMKNIQTIKDIEENDFKRFWS